MTPAHFLGKICQKAIIEKDGKVFVSRGEGDTLWEFPGGRLDVDESAKEGLEREILEELGFRIVRGQAIYADRYVQQREKDVPHFIIFYLCSVEGETTPNPSAKDAHEVQEYKWLSKDELKNLPMYDDCRAGADVFCSL